MEWLSTLNELTIKSRAFIFVAFFEENKDRKHRLFRQRYEQFSEDIGERGVVVFPYQAQRELCLSDIRNCSTWPAAVLRALDLDRLPLTVIIDTNFSDFSVPRDKWAIGTQSFLKWDSYNFEPQIDAIKAGIGANRSIFEILSEMRRQELIWKDGLLLYSDFRD